MPVCEEMDDACGNARTDGGDFLQFLKRGLSERVDRPEMVDEHPRHPRSDVADSERIEHPVKRLLFALFDRVEEILRALFPPSLYSDEGGPVTVKEVEIGAVPDKSE